MSSVVSACAANLTTLDLSGCLINDDGLKWLAGKFGHSTACTRLKSLSIANASRISDTGIEALASRCHRIQYFNCAGCTRITDSGLGAFMRANSRLRVLDASYCHELTDAVCTIMGGTMSQLQSLHLNHVPKLTDQGMFDLAHGCKRLQTITLRANRQVCEAALSCNLTGRQCTAAR